MRRIAAAFFAHSIVAYTTFWGPHACAHNWYPHDCCHNDDCAPVESVVQVLPTGGGAPQLIVTTKRGTTLVPQNFPVRESKDGRMHICVRDNEYGDTDVMCLFMPPSM